MFFVRNILKHCALIDWLNSLSFKWAVMGTSWAVSTYPRSSHAETGSEGLTCVTAMILNYSRKSPLSLLIKWYCVYKKCFNIHIGRQVLIHFITSNKITNSKRLVVWVMTYYLQRQAFQDSLSRQLNFTAEVS